MSYNNNNIVDTLLEVELKEPNDFLKIRETLSRIGVASKKDKVLYQSCHILHKRGKYYITHFKELFMLDGKPTTLTQDDIGRRNTIAELLQQWGLLSIVDPARLDPVSDLTHIKIVPYREKDEWELETKYTIGAKR